MPPSPSDPFVLELREIARLIALAREWVLRGPVEPARVRERRFAHAPAAAQAAQRAAHVA